jgi:hypothetical protein
MCLSETSPRPRRSSGLNEATSQLTSYAGAYTVKGVHTRRRFSEVRLREGKDFFADGEEVVTSHVKDALFRVKGEGVGCDLEHVAAVDSLHVESVVGDGEREYLFFHDQRFGALGDVGWEDSDGVGGWGELDCHIGWILGMMYSGPMKKIW